MEVQSLQTVLVTGGASGIGEAICDKLSAEDFAVSVTDIQKLRSSSCLFYRCDVRKRRQVSHLYDWVLKNTGVPDILILNAGVGIKEKLAEGDPEKWQKVMDVNVMGALRVARFFTANARAEIRTHHLYFFRICQSAAFVWRNLCCIQNRSGCHCRNPSFGNLATP